MPVVGHFEGSDLATTVWDLLAGQVEPGDEVLVFDEAGGHAGLSCAQFAAAKGSKVELVTPDRAHGLEVGAINLAAPHERALSPRRHSRRRQAVDGGAGLRENGGDKLVHGRGGISQLRAE